METCLKLLIGDGGTLIITLAEVLNVVLTCLLHGHVTVPCILKSRDHG
jgi:hypothetical protein